MNTSIEVREITNMEDLKIFQNINTLMVAALILRKANTTLRYKEFRKQVSISDYKRVTIKLVKIDPFKFEVCAKIGTEIASWTHEDLIQIEKEVLIKEGIEDNSPFMQIETVSEIYERATKTHDVDFILE